MDFDDDGVWKNLGVFGLDNICDLGHIDFDFGFLTKKESWVVEVAVKIKSLVWNVEPPLHENLELNRAIKLFKDDLSIFNIISRLIDLGLHLAEGRKAIYVSLLQLLLFLIFQVTNCNHTIISQLIIIVAIEVIINKFSFLVHLF